jgi:serine/threonine protein kinase
MVEIVPQPHLAPQASTAWRIGKYDIVQRIAYGGMAEIYLARASGIEGFEKYIVLKRILPQFAANPEFVRMFLREARLAAALDHANIAHVYDIGEDNGTFFFTMEYLHGEDVRSMMKSLRERKQGLPLEHAVAVGIGAAAGLHFAHEKKSSDGRALGIVHCDMSPSNIVVTYDGSVKIVDFGVARITADPDLSRRQSLKGKLAYMAPEQIGGKRIDCRSDLFALGIVLYELTTSRRLFRAENDAEAMRLVLDSVIVPPTQIVRDYPPALERIVMRALNRDPEQRYQKGRDLQKDLEIFARDHGLRLSSAVLAEWMEQTFGPKTEIWHRLPAPAEPPPDTRSTTVPGDGSATRVVSHAAAAVTAPQLQTLTASNRAVPPISAAAAPAALVPPPQRRLRVLVIAATSVVVIAAAVGVLLRLRSAAPPVGEQAGQPRGSTILVVGETGQVAVAASPAGISAGDRAAPIAPPPAEAASDVPSRAFPTASASAAVGAPAASSSRRHREPRGTRTPSSGDDFSAVLARREGAIRKCFNSADDAALVQGQASLRFEVAADGHVSSVTVLPAAITATRVGACLAQVGMQTVFPPQPQPVVFRIPVTVQVQRGTRSGN